VVVFGERRWRAAALAGLPSVNAVVMEGALSAEDLVAVQLVENAVREDLRPVEQARAYRRLMDAKGWSARQAARELGVDHLRVVRSLALLDLPEAVRDQVDRGAIPPTAAYEIARADPPLRDGLARKAAEARAPGAARPRKFRAEIKVPGGSVSVTLDDPEPGEDAVASALQTALRRSRKSRRGRTEAA